MDIVFKPIGYISSPYKTREEIPKQSIYSQDKTGVLKLEPEFQEGITGLKAGDHIVILFNFHKGTQPPMLIKSHRTGETTGVFATRSPNRPNGIGMSIVKILDLGQGEISFAGVDMLDQTPVLDIKPYAQELNPKF